MEDSRIVDLYWKRDESAIGVTATKYGAYCRKIAMNILYNSEDSEECVNDTYLAAWNSMPDNRPSLLGSFLAAITRNLSLDKYRRSHSQKRGEGQIDVVFDELLEVASGSSVENEAEAGRLNEAMNRFVHSLNDESRFIFVRRYFYADSLEEIAGILKITEAKIKSNLFRSRNKLRDFLMKEGFEV